MPANHTPTPEMTCEAVAKAFNSSMDLIRGDSRKTNEMQAREAYVWLLQVRSAKSVDEIVKVTGIRERDVYRHLKNVRERIRVDQDYSCRVMMAELLLIQKGWGFNDGRNIHFSIQ